jgi:hypothetical protein
MFNVTKFNTIKVIEFFSEKFKKLINRTLFIYMYISNNLKYILICSKYY